MISEGSGQQLDRRQGYADEAANDGAVEADVLEVLAYPGLHLNHEVTVVQSVEGLASGGADHAVMAGDNAAEGLACLLV